MLWSETGSLNISVMSGPRSGRFEILFARPLTWPALSVLRFVRTFPPPVSIPVVGHTGGHGALASSDTHVSTDGGSVACNVGYLVAVSQSMLRWGGVRSNIQDYHFHGLGRPQLLLRWMADKFVFIYWRTPGYRKILEISVYLSCTYKGRACPGSSAVCPSLLPPSPSRDSAISGEKSSIKGGNVVTMWTGLALVSSVYLNYSSSCDVGAARQ